MLISNTHGLVFIKTRKVGGTSFEKYFIDHHFDKSIDICTGSQINQIAPINTSLRGHVSWDVIVKEYPRCSQYKKFTIERNPWDKCVSQYYFYKHQHQQDHANLSFQEFLRKTEAIPQDIHKYSTAGELTFIKWEAIESGMHEFFASIGIEFNRKRFAEYSLKAGLRKDTHYSHLYNDDDVEIVRKVFSPQIEIFGYEFEDRR